MILRCCDCWGSIRIFGNSSSGSAVVLFGEARIKMFADTDEEALAKAVRALRGSR